MIRKIQLPLSDKEKQLQKKYGHPDIEMIRGAGKINQPKLMLLFMNPTVRNTSSCPEWSGLRAPWIGTKQVWEILIKLNLINESLVPENWDENTALELYKHIADKGLYITNLVSCTQPARSLPNSVFREYLPVFYKEVVLIKPQSIVAFGNQVSSMLLQKTVSVSNYLKKQSEVLTIGDRKFKVYPTYYPVGQGQRNMPKAIERIRLICD